MCLVLLTVWWVVCFVLFFLSSLRINSISFLRCPSILSPLWASLVPQLVKNLPAVQETWVRFQGLEDPLEMEMATHSSILAWRIPWTYGPWGHKSQTQLSNQTTTMPTSVQRIPSWENPKVGIFMIFRSDPTMGRLLFAKIYPKLQERQRAN